MRFLPFRLCKGRRQVVESCRLTVECLERNEKMKDEVSMPIAAIGGVAVGGAVVATAAVFQAYEVGQSLDLLVQGRTAAILHLVLRGAMRNAVLCAAFAVACWQYWRMPSGTWRKLLPSLLIVKVGAAVFAASSVARICSMVALRIFPALMEPIPALCGSRPFQILDLAMLFGMILLFVAVADCLQRKIDESKSMMRRVVLAALAVCFFAVLASPVTYRFVCSLIEGWNTDAKEESEEWDPNQDNEYNIDADEPWEVNA